MWGFCGKFNASTFNVRNADDSAQSLAVAFYLTGLVAGAGDDFRKRNRLAEDLVSARKISRADCQSHLADVHMDGTQGGTRRGGILNTTVFQFSKAALFHKNTSLWRGLSPRQSEKVVLLDFRQRR